MSNHFDGLYYAEPQNKYEQEQNEAKLEELQFKQKRVLQRLFEDNSDVFTGLSNTLLEKKTMNRDDLIPFLSRIVTQKPFPMPLGDFASFRMEWPE